MPVPKKRRAVPPVTVGLDELAIERELRSLRQDWKAGRLNPERYHTDCFDLYNRRGSYREAAEHAAEAHEADPCSATANNLAVAYLRTDPKRAVGILENASREFGADFVVSLNYADALARAGRDSDATRALAEAMQQLDPANPEHEFRAAHTCAVLGLDEPCLEHMLRYVRLSGKVVDPGAVGLLDSDDMRITEEVEASLARIGPQMSFLSGVSDVERSLEEREDLVHDWFDDRFHAGEFDECAFVLPLVDLEPLPPEMCVALLVATLPAKEELTTRPEFVDRVGRALERKLGDANRVAELLRHLA